MHRAFLAAITVAVTLAAAPAGAQDKPAAPAAKPPSFSTTRIEGTENVYAFTFGNRVSMFVVTTAGVIATDPGGYGQPQRVPTYLDEIRKVTDQPVKYLIYSHHHYDHIAGGQPFKDAGARIVAHKRAKERLMMIKDPATPLPDEVFDKKRVIKLGNTTLELTYHGLNHSDSTIAMRLPREKILFVVDILPVGSVPGRGMIDFYPLEAEKSIEEILKLDWDRLIPGHPGQPGGRLGTKADAQAQLAFLRDASETVKAAAREGKCWDRVEKELKLPQYESWPGYQNNLQFVLRRYCGLWGRGT
ncbi:MAG TPA: MBL fold metallo-hydrolase [Burkholderiales bacterium]|nr:MBL fold metallo-hydrolase [Burkholderiales bacterium]